MPCAALRAYLRHLLLFSQKKEVSKKKRPFPIPRKEGKQEKRNNAVCGASRLLTTLTSFFPKKRSKQEKTSVPDSPKRRKTRKAKYLCMELGGNVILSPDDISLWHKPSKNHKNSKNADFEAAAPSRNRFKKFLKKDKGVWGKRKQTFFKKFLSFPPNNYL